jgi:uncharacterized protein (DUF1800 family)
LKTGTSPLTLRRRIDIWPLAEHIAAMAALPRMRVFSFLQTAGGLTGLLALASLFFLVSPALAEELSPGAKVAHVVSRLTYGPAPGDLAKVAAMGVSEFIKSQLEPERIEEPPALAEALAALPTESMDTVRLFREYGPSVDAGQPPGPEIMRRTFDRADVAALEATKARLFRAILSNRQLNELMVAFWSEHFSLGAKKGLAHLWVGSFEREAIRPHAMGKFLDLLSATAMHPAMLIARDNWKNVVHRDGGSPTKEEINPTYAAMLLAHQTLGPGGPQKPDDTLALARILTGWRVGAARGASDSGGFYFDVGLHDPSDKVFLGQTIKGSGMAEGAAALRILAEHPATAQTICRKLAVYFLCDEPPAALIARLAAVFGSSGGDIREVLRTLFTSAEFFDPKYAVGRLKSPLRQVVSAIRALGGEPKDTAGLAGILAGLGQPLYASDTPGGYPVASGAWLKPDGLVHRVSFAGDLAAGRIPGLGIKLDQISAAALTETLGPTLSPATRQAIQKISGDSGAAILASPDFMRY